MLLSINISYMCLKKNWEGINHCIEELGTQLNCSCMFTHYRLPPSSCNMLCSIVWVGGCIIILLLLYWATSFEHHPGRGWMNSHWSWVVS
jgi:hypothetical protein